MTFTAEQKTELEKPLNRAHVKPPAPGKYGEYIEGWRVIDEANRIFGFDGWTRETDEIKCVSERETMMGRNKDKPGWAVSYIARCRIRVGAITREGCGAGQGIDADAGLAHESAIKEAETDAMKRALMTFGNPFGLALYDKTKANVGDAPKPVPAPVQAMLEAIAACDTLLPLQRWWKDTEAAVKTLPDEHYTAVVNALNARKAAIETMDRAVA